MGTGIQTQAHVPMGQVSNQLSLLPERSNPLLAQSTDAG